MMLLVNVFIQLAYFVLQVTPVKLIAGGMNVEYPKIGQRIKNERLKLNMSREKLAEILELSSVYIGQIERGERKMSLDTICKVADCFNISLDYLVNGYTKLPKKIDVAEIQTRINSCSKNEITLITDVLNAILSNLNVKDK